MGLLIGNVNKIMILYPNMAYLLDIMMMFLIDHCYQLELLAFISIYVCWG